MSGIIEGYNYDIFISYRQKDNKGEKWVSEFVESLKTELESTFRTKSVIISISIHTMVLTSGQNGTTAKLKMYLRFRMKFHTQLQKHLRLSYLMTGI